MGKLRGLGVHIFTSLFLVAIAYTCLGVGNMSVICSEQERLALLKFKHSVKDDTHMLSSWVGNECCMWERIQCDAVTGNVESLHLRGEDIYYSYDESYHYLVGNEVSSSLAELRHLKYLDLSGNDFRESRIPKFIGSLKQLEYLNLSYAGFGGIIPNHIGNLSNLKVLDLSSNYGLMIDDVAWTFSLSSLQHLDLSSTSLSRAQNWDMMLYMIPSLKELSLSYCGLSNVDIHPFQNSSRVLSHIKHLDLGLNFFRGPLPRFLQNITSLAFLDLSYCELTGPVPESLGKSSFLEILDLSGNQITGPIPTFRGKLSHLDLSLNQLNGSIPQSLGRLKFLEVLDLSNNQLTGSIPESFGRLATLKHVQLELNWLTGPIPTSLGKLGSLETFWVHSNLLNGTIPVSIGQLAKLHSLDFSNNSLEGVVFEAHFVNLLALKALDTSSNNKLKFNISHEWVPLFQLITLELGSCNIGNGFPQWLRNQTTLEWLGLSNTKILGPLPTWFQKLYIFHLDLSHNQLSGPLTNLPLGMRTKTLFLENNLFNESIPRSLCRSKNITFLDLSRNRLTGEIPKCLENLQVLATMRFSSNRLYGVIPSSIALTSLEQLNLNDNNFIGELPREFGNLPDLTVLDLGDNNFSGNISEWIGENLTSLEVLRLHRNNFTGRLPKDLCKASHLRILDVAYNNLIGSIPHCLGELNSMAEHIPLLSSNKLPLSSHNGSVVYDENVKQAMKGIDIEYTKTWELVYNMDLSSNKLVGEIPVQLTALRTLMGLNLSNNHLDGGIPDSIGNMTQLFSLDLSRNKLTGKIPSSMTALNFLSHLNLSYNNLSGQIPTGSQLQTLTDPSIYAWNKDLCGPPLSKNCSNHGNQTTTPKKKYKADDERAKVWLFGLDIICGFATGFWGIIGVLLLKKQWRMKLFMFVEETMDKIHVAVVVRVAKMKREREVV